MKKFLQIMFLLFILGCANKSATHNVSSLSSSSTITVHQPLDNLSINTPTYAITDIFNYSDNVELDESLKEIFAQFDIPVTMTPRVQFYIKYFTTNGRSSMQSWINRSNKYTHIVRARFQEENIPLDLLVLGFTESGFNPNAVSHAGATGMWQFMKGTGSHYGLEVNQWVDERRDFVKSTDAAARHLNDLNKRFNDWYLALAAYNAGPGRIAREAKAFKSNDFFAIAPKSTWMLETKDYVPKFLAQLIIYTNMKEYGFTAPTELPLLYNTVTVDEQVNLLVVAETIGCTIDELKELNPELLTPMTPPVKGYKLRVPTNKFDIAKSVIENKAELARYTVYNAKSGETLARIAKAHNVTVDAIQNVNNYPYNSVYGDKVLFIPKMNSKQDVRLDEKFASAIEGLSPRYYTVRKGDNFSLISRKHNMPVTTLKKLNPDINPAMIFPGQVLVISMGVDELLTAYAN